MKVIIKHPGNEPCFGEIPGTLEALQELVGGDIQAVRIGTDLVAIVDEEGKKKGKPENMHGLVGTIVFLGESGCEFTDVPASAELLFFGRRQGPPTWEDPCIHCGKPTVEGHLECGACEAEARSRT